MVQMKNNYVYGTAAKKIEYDVYEHNNVLKEKKKYKSNIFLKVKIVAAILLLFLGGLTVMYRYALIADLNYEINNKERNYENLRNENSRIKVAIENQTNLSKIMEIAQNDLGMQKPDRYQILHIRVPKTNYTVTSEQYKNAKANEANENFFAELINTGKIIKKLFN